MFKISVINSKVLLIKNPFCFTSRVSMASLIFYFDFEVLFDLDYITVHFESLIKRLLSFKIPTWFSFKASKMITCQNGMKLHWKIDNSLHLIEQTGDSLESWIVLKGCQNFLYPVSAPFFINHKNNSISISLIFLFYPQL